MNRVKMMPGILSAPFGAPPEKTLDAPWRTDWDDYTNMKTRLIGGIEYLTNLSWVEKEVQWNRALA